MSTYEYRGTIADMLGATIAKITGGETGSEAMTFVADDGRVFAFEHHQDCCESVEIVDVIGDVADLIGSPLLMAEEVSSENEPKPAYDTPDAWCTWTFYKFATIRGYVTVRWCGSSNGYYSEDVCFTATAAASVES